jgi:hypothetical protein
VLVLFRGLYSLMGYAARPCLEETGQA